MNEKKMDFDEERIKRPDWAERIKKVRKSKEITQMELYKEIGGTLSSILYYEKGTREPKLSYLMDLIRLTGVDGDWLLTGKGEMYGEKKKITKEDAIALLFGDKADSLLLYLLEAMKDPFIRAIMYTKILDYKASQEKD